MWGAIAQIAGPVIGGLQTRSAYNNAEKAQIDGYNAAVQGLNNTTDQIMPWLTEGANGQANAVEDAANASATGVLNAAQTGGQQVIGAGNTANSYLDPYMQAGTKSLSELANLGNQKFQFSEDDPSYQWRLQQGQKALERSAAARGGAMGGGTMKALTRYAQGAASTEYQAAFDRFQAERNSRAGILTNLTGIGATASNQAGQNTINTNRYASDLNFDGERTAGQFRTRGTEFGAGLRMNAVNNAADYKYRTGLFTADAEIGKGDVRAQAHLGRANTWNQMINGVTRGVTQADSGNYGWSGRRSTAPIWKEGEY
jgi:hypothetical protein